METIMKRTFSSSNLEATENIHGYINAQQQNLIDRVPIINRDVIKSTMIIPSQYDDNALSLCVDQNILLELQMEKSINWWFSSRFLLPLITVSDGNCLLHSVLLYIFGVHDRRNVLRGLLYQRIFMEKEQDKMQIRWKYDQQRFLKVLISTNSRSYMEEKNKTWTKIVEVSSVKTISSRFEQSRFAMLEGIHIFALSNILGRPIIVLCEQVFRNGHENSLQSMRLGGIYLPLTRMPKECEKSPIVLGYKDNHFVPLVSTENLIVHMLGKKPTETAIHCIPLLHHDMSEIPIQFLMPNEEHRRQEILENYMELCSIYCNDRKIIVQVALLKFKPPPAWSIELMWSLHKTAENVFKYTTEAAIPKYEPQYESMVPCSRQVLGCRKYASSNKQNMCATCYDEYLQRKEEVPKRRSFSKEFENRYKVSKPHVKSTVSICLTAGCKANAIPELKNKCQDCYMEDLSAVPAPNLFHINENQINKHDILLNDSHSSVRNTDIRPAVGASGGSVNTVSVLKNVQKKEDYVKKKVICVIPGCESNISSHDRLCDFHQKADKEKKICNMEDCTNRVDSDDTDLCVTCYQSQKNLLKEFERKCNSEEHRLGFNIGRGNINHQYTGNQSMNDFASIVQSLPPIPAPEIDIPALPQINHQFTYQMDDHTTLSPNRFPPNQSSSQCNVPTSSTQSFIPPQIYTGFTATAQSASSQKGNLNWQKEVSRDNKCLYCSDYANPKKNGYCNHCYDIKQTLQVKRVPGVNSTGSKYDTSSQSQCRVQSQESVNNCINGCRKQGLEMCNYLCQECYQKQIEELTATEAKPQRHGFATQNQNVLQNLQYHTSPCVTKGCVYQAIRPAKLCDVCKKNPLRYEKVPPTAGAPVAQIDEVKQKCRALGCDFFGNPEFGGYCSTCFLNITKRESTRGRGHICSQPSPSLNIRRQQSSVSSEQCRHPGCEMFGRLEQAGYCSQCYNTHYVERDCAFA